MANLTTLELEVLKAFQVNCSNADAQKIDNASWTGMDDLLDGTSLTVQIIKGVVGSLVKKALIEVEPASFGVPAAFILTNDGIDSYFNH
jgi:hypothetical protein